MGMHIGLDLGSSMIKAASATDATAAPVLLKLAGNQYLFPAAIERATSGGFIAGEAANAHRRLPHHAVAVAFRDAAISPTDRVRVGSNGELDAVTLYATLLEAVGRRIQDQAPTVESMAVSIPDHWPPGHWALPVAVSLVGWSPRFLVREWVAALAMQQGSLKTDEVVMLSLGSGGVQGTFCRFRDGSWGALAQRATQRASGRQLKAGMLQLAAESMIRGLRRDPQEDGQTDQTLNDAVDRAIEQLCTAPTARIEGEFFGQRFCRDVSRSDLGALATAFQEPVVQLVKDLLSDPACQATKCSIVAWGEQCHLLPLDAWLAPFTSSHSPLRRAPLDVVAAGAARLSAASTQSDSPWPSSWFGTARTDDGAYDRNRPPAQGDRALPVLQRCPPLADLGRLSSDVRLVFVEPNDRGRRVEITGNRFRLGRHPQCDCVFGEPHYDSVSAKHADVIRDGPVYLVADLESTNGTYVNEQLIRKPQALKSGDIIGLGREGPRLRFEQG